MKKILLLFNPICFTGMVVLFIGAVFLGGCMPAKKAMYFPDITAGQVTIDSVISESAKKVYPGDRIVIQMLTGDAESNQVLNISQGKASNEQKTEGFLVDRDGFVQIPILGSIAVKGLTSTEIRDLVQSRLKELYKDVVVYCTISGRVVVLNSLNSNFGGGGMNTSGGGGGVMSIPVMDERLTILEVLSTMRTSNLKLDKAWIIREVDGKRITAPMNLNSKELFNSPYYYLRNNDVVYIEPNKLNQFLEANAPSRSLLGIVTGMTGLFLSLIVLLK
jgi:polysaccharide export outer membrane protein